MSTLLLDDEPDTLSRNRSSLAAVAVLGTFAVVVLVVVGVLFLHHGSRQHQLEKSGFHPVGVFSGSTLWVRQESAATSSADAMLDLEVTGPRSGWCSAAAPAHVSLTLCDETVDGQPRVVVVAVPTGTHAATLTLDGGATFAMTVFPKATGDPIALAAVQIGNDEGVGGALTDGSTVRKITYLDPLGHRIKVTP